MHGLDEIVRAHPFFRDMEEGLIKVVIGCGRNMRFKPGSFIFREGDAANSFYCIRHGSVALELHAPSSGAVEIDHRESGDVVGWSWIVPPYEWYCDARAVNDVRALVFDGACLRGKFEADVGLGYEMYKRFVPLISRSLQATRLQLLDVYGAD